MTKFFLWVLSPLLTHFAKQELQSGIRESHRAVRPKSLAIELIAIKVEHGAIVCAAMSGEFTASPTCVLQFDCDFVTIDVENQIGLNAVLLVVNRADADGVAGLCRHYPCPGFGPRGGVELSAYRSWCNVANHHGNRNRARQRTFHFRSVLFISRVMSEVTALQAVLRVSTYQGNFAHRAYAIALPSSGSVLRFNKITCCPMLSVRYE